ncbi:STM4012 family radical SAM protein [Pseudanabaena sp. PCC 6802]|uniref:STM4012 family radical SAM protein n=1 Tax=Pseudanabaena sp. PCC 6802 TaxID=118173 RepID=UPI0003456B38|nr:STM4012 family radical SAM protein [Pseudanabaena sp. PCC 6802]
MSSLKAMLVDSAYQAYAYAYPHKTAYRPLEQAIALDRVWSTERRDALFLYVHIPFCEMRCGFCNLFTQAIPQDRLVAAYLAALQRQAIRVRASLGKARFARLAIGGGTPTFLDVADLTNLFDLIESTMGAEPHKIPVSVEVSPQTATEARLALLRSRGVDRISIGVQSFIAAETAAAGRPQQVATVYRALEQIRHMDFPTLNIDLIYGLPGQTVESWLASIKTALEFAPEELYLYPLYVRPLTGLGRSQKEWNDDRPSFYRQARDLLCDRGYNQISMRMFRAQHAPTATAPIYCCQDDGMVGLGCGARSYTQKLHYSSEYAVGAKGVADILSAYIAKSSDAFGLADYGFPLNAEEQRRRYTIQSLLQQEGLSFANYQQRFGSHILSDLPELSELESLNLAVANATPPESYESRERPWQRLQLTAMGMEHSDTIGPWLYSNKVKHLMETYTWH